MNNSKENQNILVNRALLYKKQKELLNNNKQIANTDLTSIQNKRENSELNRTVSIESQLVNLYLQGESTPTEYFEQIDIEKDSRQAFNTEKSELLRSKKYKSKHSFKMPPDPSPLKNNKIKPNAILDFLLYSKHIGIESFKQFSIRPTRLNIMLSSVFFFIAICSTIERRENKGYLSILLQGKMPGYATLYQNSCWESFESLTAKYLNSGVGYSSDIDLYKDRALLSLNSPWNKQVQKDFRAFFIDTLSIKNNTTKSRGDNYNSKQSKYILSPWYKIDACAIPSDVIIATRETSHDFKDSFVNLDNQKSSTKHNNQHFGQIRGLEYIIPYYKNKQGFFLENDSIPSKCNSGYLLSLSPTKSKDTLDLSTTSASQFGFTLLNIENTKPSIQDSAINEYVGHKNKHRSSSLDLHKMGVDSGPYSWQGSAHQRGASSSERYLSAFHNILNQHFYGDGLLLVNLAETASRSHLLANRSQSTQTTKADKKQNATDKIESFTADKPLEKTASHGSLSEPSFDLKPLKWYTKINDAILFEKLKESTYKSDIEQLLNWDQLEFGLEKQKTNFEKTLKNLFCNSFRENNWGSMRYVSGYKFPDLNKLSVTSLFKQFAIRHLFVSSSISFDCSQLVNQVLLTPFYFKLPPSLPICYFNNLALESKNELDSFEPLSEASISQNYVSKRETTGLSGLDTHIGIKIKDSDSLQSDITFLYKAITLPEFKQITKLFNKFGLDYQDYLKQPKDSPFAILISPSLEDDEAIKLEAERKTGQGEKKMTPFQLLQEVRETEQHVEEAKDLRHFSAKNILAYQPLNDNYDLVFERSRNKQEVSDFVETCSNTLPQISTEPIVDSERMLSDRKSSFFGEMSLLPKVLIAKDQKDIKEQIIDVNLPNKTNNGASKSVSVDHVQPAVHLSFPLSKPSFDESALHMDKKEAKVSMPLPDLQLRAEKDVIDLIESANLEARNTIGAHHRTFNADLYSSLKGLSGRGDVEKFCFSGCQKRRIASNLFVAPSQQHVLLPQINSSDWKKILEWQLRTYLFDEEKRLQSLRESNPEKQFKIKKLTIYLPWVTFRTAINKNFEWPLTRLDFDEFVPIGQKLNREELFQNQGSVNRMVNQKQAKSVKQKQANFFLKKQKTELNKGLQIKYPKWQNLDYMLALKNVTLSGSGKQNNKVLQSKQSSQYQSDASREKSINKHYLFEAVTNQSYLLIYRLFLFFVLKNVFQYVYRISLRQFIIKMSYSDFGLTVTSPEFREWLQNTTPKSVYKVHKPLQSITGIEQNIATISQIIWHLRNFGRTRHKIPGVLILGSAATEKTSLVQAIASEAKVAVVVQPMDALLTNGVSPYDKLEEVFLLARKQAPCILFLDSLDRVGKSRKNVVSNYAGAEDSLFCLDADIAEGKHDFANLSHSLQTRLLLNKHDASNSNFEKFCLYSDDAISDSTFFDEQDTAQNNDKTATSPLAFYQEKTEFESLRINLLLRLLTEIDGISPLQGVIVMATSEQTATLDPALLRPGRFQTIIKLSLPDQETRIQLFKIESQKLGSSPYIPWDYLAIRTNNMSGADIISVINHSAIRAILDNTVHTLQSLEHGLNYVLALPNSKKLPVSQSNNDPFHTSRLAFYQAGKVVVQNLLIEYPNDAFFNLDSALLNTEQNKSNTRLNINVAQQDLKSNNFDTSSSSNVSLKASPKQNSSDTNIKTFSATTKTHFQTRLVALYSGKAAELLHLNCTTALTQNTPYIDPFRHLTRKNLSILFTSTPVLAFGEAKSKSQNSTLHKLLKTYNFNAKEWQSNLAFSDLLTASSIIHAMIDRWYLYSQRLFTFKINQVVASLNYEQMQEQQHFVLFHKLSKQVYSERAKVGFWSNSEEQNKQVTQTGELSAIKQLRQERQKISWWNEKICQEVEMFERPYGKWYRLYLPKVEQRERNEEWVPPDLIFHDVSSPSNISKDHSTSLKTLHDLYLFERDSAYYNVVMNCFYKAFNLLNENRELLDFLADHFIRFKKVRSPEISKICSLYLR